MVPHGGALQTVVTTHGHKNNVMGWDQQLKKPTVDRNVCVCVCVCLCTGLWSKASLFLCDEILKIQKPTALCDSNISDLLKQSIRVGVNY